MDHKKDEEEDVYYGVGPSSSSCSASASSSSSSSCCWLACWIKCKRFMKKWINCGGETDRANNEKNAEWSRSQISTIISDPQSFSSIMLENNVGVESTRVIIECSNCHSKSLASLNWIDQHRSCSMFQMNSSVPSGGAAAGPITKSRSQPNTPGIMSTGNSVVCSPMFTNNHITQSKLSTKQSGGRLGIKSSEGGSGPRSPSNYCRVATCERLHIHDLTPKCLETFAPSSTCSSCQHCDEPHIGPNHDQLLMVKSLLKELPLTPISTDPSDSSGKKGETRSTSHLLMQWPLPEYRPQNSPDHLYRTFHSKQHTINHTPVRSNVSTKKIGVKIT